jgi:tetratricopeptide (TPR) repeat protein
MPLLGTLMTGLLLLGAPAVSGAATKKKPIPAKKKAVPAAQKPDSPAQALYDDAAKLLRARQYAEAETLAKRCIDTDPQFAECHMVRGAALAGETQWEEAADEYRAFLRLAPSHPLAPKVQQTLENYEKTKTQLP